jgi:predicted acetyltransferase
MATEILAATHDAGRRLLAFLAQHQSMCGEMVITRGPNDPFISLLREQSATIEVRGVWMLRIVDVRKGLERRGYLPGLSGEVHLEIEDDVVPQNEGRWILRVEDGEARVEPGGRGELRMHVRGLASLYSGYRSAEQAMVMGLAEGDAEAARAATALFAGPSPWMVEIF